MRTLTFLFVGLFFVVRAEADDIIQSRFIGPVRLAVWEHWQPSWNIERDTSFPAKFELVRGAKGPSGPAFTRLTYFGEEKNLRVRMSGRAFYRTGEYSDSEKDIPTVEINGDWREGKTLFELNDDRFMDISGKQIVTRISFDIFAGSESILSYQLVPMYVRGSRNFHWETETDPYMAHAGAGEIEISNGTTTDDEPPVDFWNGTLVRPELRFIDRNRLGAGGRIGLHRHVSNQEMWLVESGNIIASHGMAPMTSESPMRVERQWSSRGDTKTVTQFHAQGGWIEERAMQTGEYFVIVPNGDINNVCFHGLLATSRSITFTMGRKN
jgi:hypothetical protein